MLHSPTLSQQPHTISDAEVGKITRDAILIDTPNDVSSKTVTGYDIATPNKSGQTGLPPVGFKP